VEPFAAVAGASLMPFWIWVRANLLAGSSAMGLEFPEICRGLEFVPNVRKGGMTYNAAKSCEFASRLAVILDTKNEGWMIVALVLKLPALAIGKDASAVFSAGVFWWEEDNHANGQVILRKIAFGRI
jgi:hypothetical protein